MVNFKIDAPDVLSRPMSYFFSLQPRKVRAIPADPRKNATKFEGKS